MCSKITPKRSAADHDQGLRPINRVCQNEDQHGNAVGGAAQNNLERVHLVDVSHPEGRKHGKNYESHTPAKISAVDGNQKLKTGRRRKSANTRSSCHPLRILSAELWSKGEQQGCCQHQPGQDAQECCSWRAQQKNCADNPASQADQDQCHQHSPAHVQVMTKRSAAESQSCPQRDCVGGIGWYRWNSSEQQSRERNKAATAG